MGGLQKYFTIHSLPVFCCLLAMWDPSAGWGTGLFSFSSSTCAAPDHSEVGEGLKSFSGTFGLWVMPLTFGGLRKGGTRYILCLEWPLDCGWFMISRIKVSRTDCFPPACLEIFMFELNTHKWWDIVWANIAGWCVWSQKPSVLHAAAFQITRVGTENFFLLPYKFFGWPNN